jgi:hypothetical protein
MTWGEKGRGEEKGEEEVEEMENFFDSCMVLASSEIGRERGEKEVGGMPDEGRGGG